MKLLIADDHTLLRDAIAELISNEVPNSHIRTCGSYKEACVILNEDEEIKTVLLDLYMPGMNGVSGASEMVRCYPDKYVILLSGSASHSDMIQAFKSNIHGFISKEISGKALVAAVRLVECGERYFPHRMTDVMPDAKGSVTHRERMVLKELMNGSTNKGIAQSLGIEEATVKSVLRAVGLKLGARKRTDIALRAAQIIDSASD